MDAKLRPLATRNFSDSGCFWQVKPYKAPSISNNFLKLLPKPKIKEFFEKSPSNHSLNELLKFSHYSSMSSSSPCLAIGSIVHKDDFFHDSCA
jgi:hypothetical protein